MRIWFVFRRRLRRPVVEQSVGCGGKFSTRGPSQTQNRKRPTGTPGTRAFHNDATLLARLVAAIRRGCVHATRAPSTSSTIIRGIAVLLPRGRCGRRVDWAKCFFGFVSSLDSRAQRPSDIGDLRTWPEKRERCRRVKTTQPQIGFQPLSVVLPLRPRLHAAYVLFTRPKCRSRANHVPLPPVRLSHKQVR